MSSKEKKMAAAAEEAKKNRKFYTACIVFIVCLAIVVAAAALINSNISTTKTTAISIGETEYSPAEFGYFYRSAVSSTYASIYESYGEMAAYLLDTTRPLSEQVSLFGDGTQTWSEYFYNQAVINLTNLTMLYDQAVKAGMTLSDDDKAAIEADIAYYEQVAASNNYGDLEAFLALNFGKGFDSKLLRELAEKQYLAAQYATQLEESFEYTAEEIEEHYTTNADKFDFVKFHYYLVGTAGEAFTSLSDEEKVAAAHEAAEEIALAKNSEEFTKLVRDFVPGTSKSLYERTESTMTITQGQSVSEVYRDWILDENRTEGETTVIDTEGGSYALMFVSRNDNHYQLVDVRHILIPALADENDQFTEEALASAKAEAERIYALWQENPTEDNFAALAAEYSQDEGSMANGGLYREVYQDYMVEEFNNFLFHEGKKPGDTGIVYGSNGSYAGYHIMYFSALGDMFSDRISESDMRAADYNEVINGLVENYPVAEGSGMKHVNLD
ncbi:MAG: hypothetical protein E7420_04925 [Ruminococcaceae bacterium]|nr:hypothetical protein [Oscillospiraceae bacterium]